MDTCWTYLLFSMSKSEGITSLSKSTEHRTQSTELTLLCPALLMLCHYRDQTSAYQCLHSSLRATSQLTSEGWIFDLISESESPRLSASICGAFIYPNQRHGNHVSLHPWKTNPPESHQLHLWYVCMHVHMHVSICHFGELGSHSRTCTCKASTLRLSHTSVPCSINLSSISLLLFISTTILMKTSFLLCYPFSNGNHLICLPSTLWLPMIYSPQDDMYPSFLPSIQNLARAFHLKMKSVLASAAHILKLEWYRED